MRRISPSPCRKAVGLSFADELSAAIDHCDMPPLRRLLSRNRKADQTIGNQGIDKKCKVHAPLESPSHGGADASWELFRFQVGEQAFFYRSFDKEASPVS